MQRLKEPAKEENQIQAKFWRIKRYRSVQIQAIDRDKSLKRRTKSINSILHKGKTFQVTKLKFLLILTSNPLRKIAEASQSII